MAVGYVEIADHPSGTGVSTLTVDLSTVSIDDLMIFAFGFEGVAAGSGPWIVPNTNTGVNQIGPGKGYKQVAHEDPSATGCGLEVWAAILGGGTTIDVKFAANMNVQCVVAIYSGEYAGTGGFLINNGAVRASTSEQVRGDNPNAPAVYSYVDEMVVAIGADTLASPGFGTPTPAGWSSRGDYSRAGHGTVEVTVADKPTTVEGDTGSIPFTATASPSGADGATATLAIRPVPPAATSPMIAVEFAVAN